MAATPESKVKAVVKKLLEEYGAYYYFVAQNGYGVSGGFDIFAVLNGHFIGIEVKADGAKRPTPLQSRNASKAIAGGGTVLLIHSDNIFILKQELSRIKESDNGIKGGVFWPFDSNK